MAANQTPSAANFWFSVFVAAVIAATGWFAFEHYWRAKGYVPSVMDSKELWSQQRAAVSRGGEIIPVALLGASRIQFGISPAAFNGEARRLRANASAYMLAINGHYPMATLRDLAADASFRGVAIVGVDSRGLQKIHREMQAPWPQYFSHDWTPARNLHRTLLTELQRVSIAARPDFSWSNLLNRRLNSWGLPQQEYVTFFDDRSGVTDYARVNVEAIREARVRDLKDYYATTSAISAYQWLRDNDDVIEWVKAINARGGRVVFYREPISGEHLALDEARFPRAQFWDALAAKMPATFIDFRDYPALNFPTPDTSHIDAKDVDQHTRALVQLLINMGVIATKT